MLAHLLSFKALLALILVSGAGLFFRTLGLFKGDHRLLLVQVELAGPALELMRSSGDDASLGQIWKRQPLHLVGASGLTGHWNHPGLVLKPSAGGRKWSACLSLPLGSTLEFKVTRGSWDNEACLASGDPMPNFCVTLQGHSKCRIRITNFKDHTSRPAHSRTGLFEELGAVKSQFLDCPHEVLVYLPPDYHGSSERYPVLYMHDGNNMFDSATAFGGNEWHVDEVAEAMIRSGLIRPFIGVAVYNTFQREYEYTHQRDNRTSSGGGAGAYGKFLAQELKPLVDSRYRTLTDAPNTAVMGSSLGGLLSLYLGVKQGSVFGMAAAVSPSIWWGGGSILEVIARADTSEIARRIWLCIGDREGGGGQPLEESSYQAAGALDEKSVMKGNAAFPGPRTVAGLMAGNASRQVAAAVNAARKASLALSSKGLEWGREVILCEVHGGRHSEFDWAARIHMILAWLYGKEHFDPEKLPALEHWQSYYGSAQDAEAGACRAESWVPLGVAFGLYSPVREK